MKHRFGTGSLLQVQGLVLLAFLLWFWGCQRPANALPGPSRLPSPSPTQAFLPGHWVVTQAVGRECRYYIVRARIDLALEDLERGKVLARPCREVNEVVMAGSTMLLRGPCPPAGSAEGETCWLARSWPDGKGWQQTPLQAPILLFDRQVLFPCGSDFFQWCRWQPGEDAIRAYAPIQIPSQAQPDVWMPLAWRPPWLLMAEEAPCGWGRGGKVVSVFQKYWLINLVTGLPSPWKVWEAMDVVPRCLHEGESLDGYARINLMGWNPARSDELAFAVRRFPEGYYEQPLDMYPFRTEIYVWGGSGEFVKIGTFPRLACGLWAPDGRGWLCQRLDEAGRVASNVFLTRQGAIVAQWPPPAGIAILQWIP